MWFQFGGHCDGETDCFNVAKREVKEEAGIKDFELRHQSIFNVSTITVPFSKTKNEPEHIHYDINLLFLINKRDFSISNESLEIKWVNINTAKKLVNKNDFGMINMIEKYENWYAKHHNKNINL